MSVNKMSKSLNNYIALEDAPNDMYGKLLSISDELMWKYYELLSDKNINEIKQLKQDVSDGKVHPKMAKEMLAVEITARFYDQNIAKEAKEYFNNKITNKNTPDDIEEFKFQKDVAILQCVG